MRLSSDGECDLDEPFGLWDKVPGLELQAKSPKDSGAVLTSDELYIVFYRSFTFQPGEPDPPPPGLHGARRRTRNEPFGEVHRIVGESGGRPSLSSDGLTLWFYPSAPDGALGRELRVARRASREEAWVLQPDQFPESPQLAVVSGDGMTVYFKKFGEGIFLRRWLSPGWGDEEEVLRTDGYPLATSADGRILVFEVSPIRLDEGIWFMERNGAGVFGTPKRYPEFSGRFGGTASPSWVSPNGCRAYCSYATPGLWIAQRGK